MRRWLTIVTVTGLALLAALTVAYFFLPAIGSVSGTALHRSVSAEVKGSLPSESDRCRKQSDTAWDCPIGDAQGSGSAEYRVTMRGRRCWQARKVSSNNAEEGPPFLRPAARGCVDFRDQARPLERIL